MLSQLQKNRVFVLSAFICVNLWLILLSSCATKPTDMRTLVPADSLVYLETNDLAAALQPIIDSKPFTEAAKSKPDLSAIKGVQLAVAVTGFETSEEKINDDQSIGKIQPRFVAIADTHAWNFQAVGFAESKLGSFVAKIYDSEPSLEKSEKNGGKYFTWTATDGRKAYALVIDSLIYFGNDETSIDKCLAVRRGETDSIITTGKIQPADRQTLASGYVSTDGIDQIANIIGLKFASETSEDSEIQSAIAGILPKLLRNMITEISWTATKTDQGIEDKYVVSLPPDISNVFSETMEPLNTTDERMLALTPTDSDVVTQYNLKNPQLAWRSLILTLQNLVDPLVGRTIPIFANTFFEPYGIQDGDMFLGASSPTLIVVKDRDDDNVAIISKPVDDNKSQQSLLPGFSHTEGNAAIFDKDNLKIVMSITGNPDVVKRCFQAERSGNNLATDVRFAGVNLLRTSARTKGVEHDTASIVADVLSEKKSANAMADSSYYTETRFTKTGIERRTVSDFGLIGSIIAQLSEN